MWCFACILHVEKHVAVRSCGAPTGHLHRHQCSAGIAFSQYRRTESLPRTRKLGPRAARSSRVQTFPLEDSGTAVLTVRAASNASYGHRSNTGRCTGAQRSEMTIDWISCMTSSAPWIRPLRRACKRGYAGATAYRRVGNKGLCHPLQQRSLPRGMTDGCREERKREKKKEGKTEERLKETDDPSRR